MEVNIVRVSVAVLALFLMPTALAAAPANCAKPVTFYLDSLKYTSKAAFPDPEERVELSFLDRFSPVPKADVCGVSYRADTRAETIKASAAKLNTLATVFSARGKNEGQVMLYGLFTARGDKARASELTYDLKARRIDFKPAAEMMAKYTLGVKLDGGPLQPLYYNNAVTPISVPPTTRTIDVYAKLGPDVIGIWQRVTLNLRSPSVTLYKEAAFPPK